MENLSLNKIEITKEELLKVINFDSKNVEKFYNPCKIEVYNNKNLIGYFIADDNVCVLKIYKTELEEEFMYDSCKKLFNTWDTLMIFSNNYEEIKPYYNLGTKFTYVCDKYSSCENNCSEIGYCTKEMKGEKCDEVHHMRGILYSFDII